MAKLKDIKGSAIQYLAEDPVEYVGSWSSGASMNTARVRLGSAGTPSAALGFGGAEPGYSAKTESWNGSAWSEVNDLNTARRSMAGTGVQTSAIQGGGFENPTPGVPGNTNKAETWDGTNWTEVSEINSARRGAAGIGTAAGSLLSGGIIPPGITAINESWNGSTWTEVNDLNSARSNVSGTGSTTAGIVIAGDSGPGTSGLTETWNGTSFTEDADLNTARAEQAAAGTQTDAIVFGGYTTANIANTESWNGTAWTEVNDLGTARSTLGGTGPTGSAALAFGGGTPTLTGATEEWSFPPSTSTILQEGQLWFNYTSSALKGYGTAAGIPAGTWASGGDINNAREGGCWFGSLTAGVAAGGDSPGVYVEHYDGSSWASQSAIPQRAVRGSGTGPQTAGLIYGMGHAPSGASRGDGFSYDGANWTAIAELNTARTSGGSAGGSQTSAMIASGTPPTTVNVETWNGSSWTEVGNMNVGRYSLVGGGTTTSAVMAGGYGGTPTTNPTQSETWDGTSWTESSELNTGRAFLTGGGNSSDQVILFGGGPFSPTTEKTEFWNGSSWTELNDMASVSETSFGTTQGAGVGTYRASGRISGTIQANTEEWTVDAAVSTVTTS